MKQILFSLVSLMLLSLGANQLQAASAPTPLPVATQAQWTDAPATHWDTMADMAQTRREKRLVRRLEKLESRVTDEGERSYLVALLLAIFLGYLGIDRFYLGYPGWGVVKLFTGGLFGIMWIIDIILIALGALRPKRGGYKV